MLIIIKILIYSIIILCDMDRKLKQAVIGIFAPYIFGSIQINTPDFMNLFVHILKEYK